MHMESVEHTSAIESKDVEIFENTILDDDGMISCLGTEDSYRIEMEGEGHELLCER